TSSARPRTRPAPCGRRWRSRAGSRTGRDRAAMRVLIVDNYDSFTYNLVQYLGELGAELDVVRNDVASTAELVERRPDRAVVSPGPSAPPDAGISVETIPLTAEAGIPVLGACRCIQSRAAASGGA